MVGVFWEARSVGEGVFQGDVFGGVGVWEDEVGADYG